MISSRFAPSLLLALAACGLAAARQSQDWSKVTDPRLFRCCHIGNDGTGVLLAQDRDALWILTNASLVSRVAKVHVVDPASRDWRETTAWVVARSEENGTDLALLRAAPMPFPPFVTRLANPITDGTSRDVDLLPVSVSDTPRAYRLPAVGRMETSTATEAVCVHGGVRQANSGTPVFDGDRLVGLAQPRTITAMLENVGDDGTVAKKKVVGIGASTPQSIEAFLRANGPAALADRLTDATR